MPGRISSCLSSPLSPFFFFYSSLFPFNLFPQLLTRFPILYSIFWELALSSPIPSCASPIPTKSFLDTYPLTIASLGLPFSFIKPHVVPTSSFFHASSFFLLDPIESVLSEFSDQMDKHLIKYLLGHPYPPSAPEMADDIFFLLWCLTLRDSFVGALPNYGCSLLFQFN